MSGRYSRSPTRVKWRSKVHYNSNRSITKKGMAAAIKDKSSHTVTRKFEKMPKMQSPPRLILTDREKEFVNKYLETMCTKYGTVIEHGSPYSPTTTCAVERFNQTLMSKLRKITNYGYLDWEENLGNAVIGYNTSFTRTVKCTPVKLEKRKLTELREIIKGLVEYKKEYCKTGRSSYLQLEVGELAWYYNPVKVRNKLFAIWSEVVRVVMCKFNSYTITRMNGVQLIVNK